MNREMLTQAIANLEAVATEMRRDGASSPHIQCWTEKVLTAVSDLNEVDCQPDGRGLVGDPLTSQLLDLITLMPDSQTDEIVTYIAELRRTRALHRATAQSHP